MALIRRSMALYSLMFHSDGSFWLSFSLNRMALLSFILFYVADIFFLTFSPLLVFFASLNFTSWMALKIVFFHGSF